MNLGWLARPDLGSQPEPETNVVLMPMSFSGSCQAHVRVVLSQAPVLASCSSFTILLLILRPVFDLGWLLACAGFRLRPMFKISLSSDLRSSFVLPLSDGLSSTSP